MRKFKMCYNPTTQQKVKVYSLAEELQFFASLGYTLDAEFISKADKEWQTDLTEGQKEFLEERKDFNEFIKTHQGEYTHAIYQYGTDYLGEISNLDLVRLCILATYSSSSGACYDENRNEIKRSSLSKIWDVHKTQIADTYNNLIEKGYIYLNDNKQIIVNTEIFKYGKMEGIDMNNKTYTRMFNEKLLGLYHNTNKRSRKQIGMMLRLLPYINYKYNVLCKNPEEYIKDNIRPLNWMDVCEILGKDADATVTRTKNTLMKLEIDGFDVVGYFKTGSGYHIVINPKVYYAGSNLSDIKHLYTMFDMPVTK